MEGEDGTWPSWSCIQSALSSPIQTHCATRRAGGTSITCGKIKTCLTTRATQQIGARDARGIASTAFAFEEKASQSARLASARLADYKTSVRPVAEKPACSSKCFALGKSSATRNQVRHREPKS
uniref:Uncharacterized protein n=1 Tax=Compsopogon caeruleus TaxID=31354 RepID=A0A7S1T699_9RHOD